MLGVILLYVRITSNSVSEMCLIYFGPEIEVKVFKKFISMSYVYVFMQIQKTIKKTARREQLMREEVEQKRLKTVLELQYVLDKLGDDEVRTDLKQGLNGVPILSEEELSLLDEFYKLADPERDMSLRYSGIIETSKCCVDN